MKYFLAAYVVSSLIILVTGLGVTFNYIDPDFMRKYRLEELAFGALIIQILLIIPGIYLLWSYL